jgi:hypothetical protein
LIFITLTELTKYFSAMCQVEDSKPRPGERITDDEGGQSRPRVNDKKQQEEVTGAIQ